MTVFQHIGISQQWDDNVFIRLKKREVVLTKRIRRVKKMTFKTEGELGWAEKCHIWHVKRFKIVEELNAELTAVKHLNKFNPLIHKIV